MGKFKVGDRVVCIVPKKGTEKYEDHNIGGGAGWEKGHEFTITSISNSKYECKVYWQGVEGCGVYEPYLQLAVNSWKERYGGTK